MSDSVTHLRALAIGQSPYAVANAALDAASPAALFGIDAVGTSGLTLSLFGGKVLVGGAVTSVSNQATLAMTASATNYVEFDPTGTGSTSGIRMNTAGFTAGRVPLYSVVCGSTAITSWTDHRVWGAPRQPRVVVNMAADANITLSQAQGAADIVELTSVTLTATRNVVLPLIPKQWTVYNNTTGAQSLQFIGATGTGVTVATGKRAIIYADGTNIVRVTADA